MEFLNTISLEQLLTATGFIAYLIYENANMRRRLAQERAARDELMAQYIAALKDANRDLLGAVKQLDSAVQALGAVK